MAVFKPSGVCRTDNNGPPPSIEAWIEHPRLLQLHRRVAGFHVPCSRFFARHTEAGPVWVARANARNRPGAPQLT